MKLRNIGWRMKMTTISSHLGQRAVKIEHSPPCLVATMIGFITVSGSMDVSIGGTKVHTKVGLS